MKLISLTIGFLLSLPVHAFEWSDLWLNDHQKAQRLLQENPAAAADTFPEPEWQGVAKYNSGDFTAAADKFNAVDSSASNYNLGNALAKAGELEQAVESYEKLLEEPDLASTLREDATFNRDLVKQLLEQQESQQSEENSDDQNESGENQESQDNDQQGQESQDQSDAEQSESEQSEDESSDENQDQQAAQDEEQESNNEESENRDEKSEQEKQAESENQQAQHTQDEPMTEDQQATEQWLRQIPDDPSGLLRRKLVQSHRSKYPQVQSGGQAW